MGTFGVVGEFWTLSLEHGNRMQSGWFEIRQKTKKSPAHRNRCGGVFSPEDVNFPRFKAKAGEEADIIEAMAGTRAQRQRARR